MSDPFIIYISSSHCVKPDTNSSHAQDFKRASTKSFPADTRHSCVPDKELSCRYASFLRPRQRAFLQIRVFPASQTKSFPADTRISCVPDKELSCRYAYFLRPRQRAFLQIRVFPASQSHRCTHDTKIVIIDTQQL